MKYLSLDLETTGLNPETCQVLQIGAIVDDLQNPKPREECPTFNMIVSHEQFQGEAYALQMNSWIFKRIAGISVNETVDAIPVGRVGARTVSVKHGLKTTDPFDAFGVFLAEHFWDEKKRKTQAIVAGKNVASFDMKFLPPSVTENFHYKTIDPAMLYFRSEDNSPPSLTKCLTRAGLDGTVSHEATDDAWAVIQLIRKHFGVEA